MPVPHRRLAPVGFLGERKGSLFVLIAPEVLADWDDATFAKYCAMVTKRVQSSPEIIGDWWDVSVDCVGDNHSIISADDAKVAIYLQSIEVLWNLGIKPALLDDTEPSAKELVDTGVLRRSESPNPG